MTDIGAQFIADSRAFLRGGYIPATERSVEGLTDDDVWWRAGECSNSIGNLIRCASRG